MSNRNTIELAVVELLEWERETGRSLPYHPRLIANVERTGMVLDLETGRETEVSDSGSVHTVDDQRWLADLEAAGGGRVTVAWAIQPDEYFAMVERGEL